jgi:hypothetical protein
VVTAERESTRCPIRLLRARYASGDHERRTDRNCVRHAFLEEGAIRATLYVRKNGCVHVPENLRV